ncbi:MAG TPA: hypothetical protein VHE35_13495 [Kofleriaceae bacterium]|nr:hypothetical protein [Kofleriaceae bacterium]
MARTQRFAIDRGGPRRLAIKRRWFGRKTEVLLDDQPVGPPIRNMRALREGADFTLPDGRRLRVGFERKLGSAGLALTLNGRPVAGAINDPRMAVRAAARLLWAVASLNLVVAGVILTFADDLRALAYGPGVVGLLLAGLGYAVYRYRSRVALAVAIAIEVLDGIVMIALASSSQPPVGAIILRVFIVAVLVRAYQSVEAAHRLDRDEVIDQAFE